LAGNDVSGLRRLVATTRLRTACFYLSVMNVDIALQVNEAGIQLLQRNAAK